jgi:hypothetical protein
MELYCSKVSNDVLEVIRKKVAEQFPDKENISVSFPRPTRNFHEMTFSIMADDEDGDSNPLISVEFYANINNCGIVHLGDIINYHDVSPEEQLLLFNHALSMCECMGYTQVHMTFVGHQKPSLAVARGCKFKEPKDMQFVNKRTSNPIYYFIKII